MKRVPTKYSLVALFAVLLLVNGCSDLDNDKYDQLSMGMNYDEVVTLLGDADECGDTDGVKKCVWGGGKKYIKVNFVGKRVVLFAAKGL